MEIETARRAQERETGKCTCFHCNLMLGVVNTLKEWAEGRIAAEEVRSEYTLGLLHGYLDASNTVLKAWRRYLRDCQS